MNFHSWFFGFFLILVYALYLSFRRQGQNRLLLVASYFFYSAWDCRFLLLIFITSVTDYFCGLKIAQSKEKKTRKAYLLLSAGVNLSILFTFKYFNFFLENFYALIALFHIEMQAPVWNIILPVGISFYTFQSMSYTIDVYRNQCKPTRNFLDYALFVSFFPQLVAGPIERARNLLPQLLSPPDSPAETDLRGIISYLLGAVQKIIHR